LWKTLRGDEPGTVMNKTRWLQSAVIISVLGQGIASAGALDACAGQFIDGNVSNAPTIFSSPPDQPFGSNQHLCYHDDGVSFYAAEYWPEQFGPRWAAYKLSPEHYGTNGCSTYTRTTADCYFQEETWSGFLNCTRARDPFHRDQMVVGDRLGRTAFASTGHDRGHMAPRQAFSWHVCGTYQTFTMANMSPQRAFLNQDIWQFLERQVLTWGVDEGPVYVVTGTTFRAFPHQRFAVYTDHILDPAALYPAGLTLQEAVVQHHAYFDATGSGEILHPKRDAHPGNVKARVRDMRMPTGYFKVIYRPARGTEPAHAIGFLLPHTFENLNQVADSYSNLSKQESFWVFVSRIDLIEETSGIRFPGIPQEMKSVWGDDWFFAHDTTRNVRSAACGRGTPQGVLVDSTRAERLAACTDLLH